MANKEVTQQRIIEFQDSIIEILETFKDGDLRAKMMIEACKSQVKDLKQQLNAK